MIDKLNPTCRRALEGAAGLCLSRTHFHVEVEHWLLKLLEDPNDDLPALFRQYGLDIAKTRREVGKTLDQFKTGNGRAPDLSFEILDLIREAWVLASLDYGAGAVRSAHVLAALLSDRTARQHVVGEQRPKQMARAHTARAVLDRGQQPGLFHHVDDIGRKRRRARIAGLHPVERLGEVGQQARRVDFPPTQDRGHIGIGAIEQADQHVLDFDVVVGAQRRGP
ncbi:MAG TPA: Clp protease N-terminal domain-containing protein, partial [Gemmataceae bacterium]|nr:Clp protease N-terminal domain-containing protein [Gemmataceae bacterium]